MVIEAPKEINGEGIISGKQARIIVCDDDPGVTMVVPLQLAEIFPQAEILAFARNQEAINAAHQSIANSQSCICILDGADKEVVTGGDTVAAIKARADDSSPIRFVLYSGDDGPTPKGTYRVIKGFGSVTDIVELQFAELGKDAAKQAEMEQVRQENEARQAEKMTDFRSRLKLGQEVAGYERHLANKQPPASYHDESDSYWRNNLAAKVQALKAFERE